MSTKEASSQLTPIKGIQITASLMSVSKEVSSNSGFLTKPKSEKFVTTVLSS